MHLLDLILHKNGSLQYYYVPRYFNAGLMLLAISLSSKPTYVASEHIQKLNELIISYPQRTRSAQRKTSIDLYLLTTDRTQSFPGQLTHRLIASQATDTHAHFRYLRRC